MKKISVLIALLIAFSSAPVANARDDIHISANSSILVEMQTGEVLFEKSAHEVRAMASITKIMSTLITIESGDLDTEFEVDSNAIKVEGTSMGLTEGDIVTKRALCYGMLLPSGNDAANAAAVAVGGDIDGFVKMMNQRAKQIGMKNSNFVTPSGLDADGHHTTAYDMAMLTRVALKNPDFAEICSTKTAKVRFGNPPHDRWLKNSNRMLKAYDGANGVKTGFTDKAGRTLVSSATRDGITLICVTLRAPNDWADHQKLLDYGFSKVERRKIEVDYSELSVDVVGGYSKTVGVLPHREPFAPKIGGKASQFDIEIKREQFVYAPVKAGDIVGEIVFKLNGEEVDSISIVASSDIDAYIAEQKESFFDKVKIFFKKLI
ncbi:MAG: D-alanyl-D-alanine carboxypeptidase [Clostridiales bacterium]|nr:D-alanyl-D-alanine carboxypeptidase [Clostridiales bacterium]